MDRRRAVALASFRLLEGGARANIWGKDSVPATGGLGGFTGVGGGWGVLVNRIVGVLLNL